MASQQQQSETQSQSSEPARDIQMQRGESSMPVRSESFRGGRGPLALLRRFDDEMTRLFDDFLGRSPFGRSTELARSAEWWPEVEVSERDDKLVVQADVPGVKKEDLSVEVRDGEICISGERRSESERSEGGFYRSERSYGSFCRVIPLPEGAKADTASATFENGVLKVEIEAPGLDLRRKARRVEIREGSAH